MSSDVSSGVSELHRWAEAMNKYLRHLVLLGALSVALLQADDAAPAEKKELLDRFDAANALFQNGKVREAAVEYQALLKEDLTPPTWGKLTFNLGMAQMRLSDFDAAIRTFERIFPSKVDDKEPGENIMEEFRNYRFRASLLIARCYEEKGNITSALSTLAKARDGHLYQAHCGTCASDADEALRSRIAELEKKMPNQTSQPTRGKAPRG